MVSGSILRLFLSYQLLTLILHELISKKIYQQNVFLACLTVSFIAHLELILDYEY